MIKSEALRYIVWVVLFGIFAGNIASLTLRIMYEDKAYVQNVLIVNLNFGDFFMGVFMSAIVIKDLMWRGDYYLHDHEWRSSVACKTFGVFALMSSEVCVLTLAVITYDRRAKVVLGMHHNPIKRRILWLIIALIWLISIVIAVIPAVVKSYFYDEEKAEGYYGTNGLCLPLQLPGEKDTGWEYCLAIFGVFNFLVACYMAWAYCSIFYATYKSSRSSGNEKGMKEEPKMAVRFFSIVFTDILCWFPIAILIFISLARAVSDTENNLYAWFSIFVAPINSAINPLIYTVTTTLFWPKFKGWFKKIANCVRSCCDCGGNQTVPTEMKPNAEMSCVIERADIPSSLNLEEGPSQIVKILQPKTTSHHHRPELGENTKENKKEQGKKVKEHEIIEVKELQKEIKSDTNQVREEETDFGGSGE